MCHQKKEKIDRQENFDQAGYLSGHTISRTIKRDIDFKMHQLISVTPLQASIKDAVRSQRQEKIDTEI